MEEINLCDTCKLCQLENICTGLPFGVTKCDEYENINS